MQEEDSGEERISEGFNSQEDVDTTDAVKSNDLMTIEQREYGLSSMKTWLLWFQHAGGAWFMIILFFCLFVDRFAYVGVEYWLARWTQGAEAPVDIFGTTFPAQTDGRSAQYRYLSVYSLVLLISMIGTLAR